MKYFIIETEDINNSLPQIINWFSQVNVQHICPEHAGKIPEHFILDMKISKNDLFPDIFSSYGFLLSKMVYEVIDMYEPHLNYKKVALIDSKVEVSDLYYLPILPICSCLLPESEWDRGRNKVLHGVIDPEQIGNHAIFRLADVNDVQIAVRLDMVESLLRRDIKGIRLSELKVKGVDG